jgi:nitroimidazol reductase NimA-like FMN-containing flavoprotein (pyridoxamine 5'-phosphate oxidase superfamily)
VLDEGLVAHVGFAPEGRPFVIPMAYGRDGDDLLLHGSPASRLMRGLKSGIEVCVTVTLLDGLVLARSSFHHSLNYRSVVVLGQAEVVDGDAAKAAALDALVEHLVPGRTADARSPSVKEMKATLVLRLPIDEASLKARSGGPIDDEEDLALPVWGGTMPLKLTPSAPEPDAHTSADLAAPSYLTTAPRFR